MLMAVDEIGRAAEMLNKGAYLPRNLRGERVGCQQSQAGLDQERGERRECAMTQRAESIAERTMGRTQREMQPDRNPLPRCVERLQGVRLGAMEARRHHHDRGSVDAFAHDEIADRGIDRRRNAVVVRAEPDAAHSAAERGSSAARSEPSADLISCSAMK